ncbi:acyl carrier protein [Saccharomonospora amisosensis]|uniref:Acyl carrier protein n=1 Tax=Saccharomonospora amisosensis TaxID=1128677 RepID=A0A7X5UQL2_9PSEU|nr:acyl carrier protein [Saccharomonospora amisosensis]NIJ12409.1 acyl carrier protein [Saccharomonospora amisosensis]
MTTTPLDPRRARQAVNEALLEIVPDADVASLGPDDELRQTLELDSMDFLAFARRLSESTGQPIDEYDYDRLTTVRACVDLLTSRR